MVKNVVTFLPRHKNRRVLVLEDNQAVVYIWRNKTSRSPFLMATLRGLMAICDVNNIAMNVQYVNTKVNLADEPSRRSGADHWKLLPEV